MHLEHRTGFFENLVCSGIAEMVGETLTFVEPPFDLVVALCYPSFPSAFGLGIHPKKYNKVIKNLKFSFSMNQYTQMVWNLSVLGF